MKLMGLSQPNHRKLLIISETLPTEITSFVIGSIIKLLLYTWQPAIIFILSNILNCWMYRRFARMKLNSFQSVSLYLAVLYYTACIIDNLLTHGVLTHGGGVKHQSVRLWISWSSTSLRYMPNTCQISLFLLLSCFTTFDRWYQPFSGSDTKVGDLPYQGLQNRQGGPVELTGC